MHVDNIVENKTEIELKRMADISKAQLTLEFIEQPRRHRLPTAGRESIGKALVSRW